MALNKTIRRLTQIMLLCVSTAYGAELSQLRAFVSHWGHATPVVSLMLSADFLDKNQAQTLTVLPPFQKHYTADNNQTSAADVGVFLGFERAITERVLAQSGISINADSEFTPEGHVWQFAQPEFANLTYAYRVHHARIMFENKLLMASWHTEAIHPYFSWEVGVALNRGAHYQEDPVIPDAVPAAPYANHYQNSFTWAVGLGVDYQLNHYARIGLGYQFLDLGSVSLGQSTAVATDETLNTPHLYANQLRFQITFMA